MSVIKVDHIEAETNPVVTVNDGLVGYKTSTSYRFHIRSIDTSPYGDSGYVQHQTSGATNSLDLAVFRRDTSGLDKIRLGFINSSASTFTSIAEVSSDGKFTVNGSELTTNPDDIKDYAGSLFVDNTSPGITFDYDTITKKVNVNPNDFTLTYTGAATGSGTVTDLGDASIALTAKNFNLTYTGAITGSGTVTNLADTTISTTAKNFNVTLTGQVTGSGTCTNLGNVTINTAVAGLSGYLPSAGGTLTGPLLMNGSNSPVTFDVGHTQNPGKGIRWVSASYDLRLVQNEADKLNIYRATGTAGNIFTFNQNGDFTAVGNVSAYSDVRLKSNIELIEDALEKIKELRGVTFDMNEKRGTGLIAQDVQKVLPEAVSEVDGKLAVAYGNIIGLLVEGIKDLSAKIEKLQAGQ